MRPGSGMVTRSMVSSSTGGNAWRSTPMGPKRRNTATRMASRTSGARALSQVEPRRRGGSAEGESSRFSASALRILLLRDHEHTHPAQLGELALMRVEHVFARILERHLENRAFT